MSFEKLLWVHNAAVMRFPHEYLDVGLNAVGLFFHDPPKNAGYAQTPVNSITFAGIGVDGIHFGTMTDSKLVDDNAPIVMTIPMAFENPNTIVGENLHDFLCLGCRHGYEFLANLHLDLESTLNHYQTPPQDFFDERQPAILEFMTSALSLSPWPNVAAHFAELQVRHKDSLRIRNESRG